MKSPWRTPDFLDLEYFFIQNKQLEEAQGADVLRDRDRNLYLNEIAGEHDENMEIDRKWLIHRWLQVRRSQENNDEPGHGLLPGRMWYELYGFFLALFSFLAMATGAGLGYSFLSYSGQQPVNVSLFFLVFVGFQVLSLFALLLTWFYRSIHSLDLRSSLLLSLVNKGLNSFLFKVRRYGLDSMDGKLRSQFSAALAAVRIRGKGYGSLFFWPLFLLFQLIGIAFNFGVIGAVLVKVTSSDLAFGWQSTIQLSSQFVSNMVGWVALPWSWLLGPTSYPDMSQIEGSRMILKDGFYHLASGDLVSWWPFLCWSICCYCLLPRMLLFTAGMFGRTRSLDRVSFNRAEHNQLLHRLLTPRLETIQRKTMLETEQAQFEERAIAEETIKEQKEAVSPKIGNLLALVPDEIFDDCDQSELKKYSQQTFGYNVAEVLRMNEAYEADGTLLNGTLLNRTLFQQLQQKSDSSCPPLLILQEAWQPPIQEMLRFLRELRTHCGEETYIIVALVGKPLPDTLFTKVADTDLRIWQQKVATLIDPWLQVSSLTDM
jgi:hypothetical protein